VKPVVIELDIVAMRYQYTVSYNYLESTTSFCTMGSETIKNVSEEKLLEFWNSINELKIWDWEKKYEELPEPKLDGVSWELKLRSTKGESLYSIGYENYPENFNKLMEAFDILVGLEFDEDNRFYKDDED